MVKDLGGQDPAAPMLRGRGQGAFQALTAADEQARQRRLADDPAAVQVGCNCHLVFYGVGGGWGGQLLPSFLCGRGEGGAREGVGGGKLFLV